MLHWGLSHGNVYLHKISFNSHPSLSADTLGLPCLWADQACRGLEKSLRQRNMWGLSHLSRCTGSIHHSFGTTQRWLKGCGVGRPEHILLAAHLRHISLIQDLLSTYYVPGICFLRLVKRSRVELEPELWSGLEEQLVHFLECEHPSVGPGGRYSGDRCLLRIPVCTCPAQLPALLTLPSPWSTAFPLSLFSSLFFTANPVMGQFKQC